MAAGGEEDCQLPAKLGQARLSFPAALRVRVRRLATLSRSAALSHTVGFMFEGKESCWHGAADRAMLTGRC
eukprot:365107-Chlamydomonas_euryale.AAC.9